MKIKTRLFINAPLKENSSQKIGGASFHHLSVLRIKMLDYISVFNASGEFLAQVSAMGKKELTVNVLQLIKAPALKNCHLHLAYAPLKKDANDFVLEKSVELGVHEITQVITAFTTNKPVDIEKSSQKLILSSQQCERLDVPVINHSLNLEKFLDKYKNQQIFWLYERSNGITMSQYLLNNKETHNKEIIFLVGPEGGFSSDEVNFLQSIDYVKQVHFNTNILRAETACLAALINFQIISCNF
ncbi:MAG: 16S rRNA (uracil(1498)-N(3))-methyltransferase [Alphaproteobacteria bacterium]|nr:16S rRNA (uracil(1498)-N(3))-methyltransferase [Alphaproteobacteria bacterium]